MQETLDRAFTERLFTSHDGTSIFFRHWPARSGTPKGAVVMFHRGHEHGGRMEHLVAESGLDEFDFYAWDARGHGRSEGAPGSAPDFATLVRDADGFVRHICEQVFAHRFRVSQALCHIVKRFGHRSNFLPPFFIIDVQIKLA